MNAGNLLSLLPLAGRLQKALATIEVDPDVKDAIAVFEEAAGILGSGTV